MKILYLIITIFLLGHYSYSDDYPIGSSADYTWSTNSNEITLETYIGTGYSTIMPDTINGYPVRYITDGLYENKTITNCVITTNLIELSRYPFKQCHLHSIIIPSNIPTISPFCFDESSLTEIELHDNLTTIETYGFSGCSWLTDITIPESVTSFGSRAFAQCGVTNVTFLGNAPSIGSAIFYNNNDDLVITAYEGATGFGGPTATNWIGITLSYIPRPGTLPIIYGIENIGKFYDIESTKIKSILTQ